jgi:hypothetical protein
MYMLSCSGASVCAIEVHVAVSIPVVNGPAPVPFAPLPIALPPPPPPAVIPPVAAVDPEDSMEIDDEEDEDEDLAAAPVAESPTARIEELEGEIARLHQRLTNEATIRVGLERRVQALEAAAADGINHR